MRALHKSKRVSWPPDFQLCQVRLFVSDDSPSQVGSESQDHLQAKSHPSEDNLPPGFGGPLSANESQIKLSDIPVIKWKCSIRIMLDEEWRVVAGEESKEVEAQNQRELRVLEAFYPGASAIPPKSRSYPLHNTRDVKWAGYKWVARVQIDMVNEWVEIAALYYMGMAGHFALGNSNTLATIDVAGAFIGISSHSTILSGILMFMITYASPLLFLLSLVMYIGGKLRNHSHLAHSDTDLGQLLKLKLGFPCLVPLCINSILLTAYTVVLLLMRNHLFVWSVFSPKYLYVCAATVCTYLGVCIVAVTVTYTLSVTTFLRSKIQLVDS